MMTSPTSLLLFALTCIAGIHLAIQQGQGCEPGPVINLTLIRNYLSWETAPDEKCEISYYLLEFISLEGVAEIYSVTDPIVRIGYLPPCQTYLFRVRQVSTDNITGQEWAVVSVTPPPEEADINLAYLNVTQEGRDVTLQWSLQPEWINCARHYQIVIYDEDTDTPKDVYTESNNLVINNTIPCGHYRFGVRAIFSLVDQGPLTMVEYVGPDDVTIAPILDNVTLNTSSFDLSWNLESYDLNRCAISAIVLDGSPYFNVSQPILDQPDRTPILVRVENLNPDNLYYLRASVENTAGISKPAMVAVQTLPLT